MDLTAKLAGLVKQLEQRHRESEEDQKILGEMNGVLEDLTSALVRRLIDVHVFVECFGC